MESELVTEKPDSNNTSLEQSQTESLRDSNKKSPDITENNLKRSRDSLDELDDISPEDPAPSQKVEGQPNVLQEKVEESTKDKEDFKGSRDSLDEVRGGVAEDKGLPVGESVSQVPQVFQIGLDAIENNPEGFYLHQGADSRSDSGSYTDSLEPDENIPRVQLLPSKSTETADDQDQPEVDQKAEEIPESKPRRKRRKSRLPVPKGMATIKKDAASKNETDNNKDTIKDEQPKSTGQNTKKCALKDGPSKRVTPILKKTTSKEKKNENVTDNTDAQITDHQRLETNGVASEKSSEKLSKTSDQDEAPEKQENTEHTTNNDSKCQRSKSVDDPGAGSKDSSRSSLSRRETMDMGDTKSCAARNLKETRMDLFMNSNEGFLIPHSQISQGGGPALRDTITSRMRLEKAHNEHLEPEKSPLDYLTPFQRKEHAIKDLKKQLKNLNKILENKDSEIAQLREGLGKEMQDLLSAKDDQIKEVQKQLNDTETRYDELKRSYEESVKTVTNLEATVKDLKESIADQNQKNESLYLEMYLKGQDAARYEREEEIEHMAGKVNDKLYKKTSTVPEVNVKELLAKLKRTQEELAKWQSLRREEAYQEVERPETEAEATLRFLRDSFFHYITDFKGQDDHMRAMIQIFNFTDVQKKKITKALLDKKSKKS